MKHEKACGAIISRQTPQGNTEILLVKQHNGLTAFPKGHTEPGETELETAKREVKEETGLDITIAPEPRYELHYTIPAGALQSSHKTINKPIAKTVVLFLATLDPTQTGNEAPQPSEISTLLWLPLNEVANHLTFPEWQQLWQRVLRENHKTYFSKF